MREMHIQSQSFFRTESKLVEGDVKATYKENHTLERLSISLGMLKSIKPLIKCFCTFTRLREFYLSNVELTTKMHF